MVKLVLGREPLVLWPSYVVLLAMLNVRKRFVFLRLAIMVAANVFTYPGGKYAANRNIFEH